MGPSAAALATEHAHNQSFPASHCPAPDLCGDTWMDARSQDCVQSELPEVGTVAPISWTCWGPVLAVLAPEKHLGSSLLRLSGASHFVGSPMMRPFSLECRPLSYPGFNDILNVDILVATATALYHRPTLIWNQACRSRLPILSTSCASSQASVNVHVTSHCDRVHDAPSNT